MSSFTYVSPDASVLIENKEDGPTPTRVLIVQGNDGRRAAVTLTPNIMRELAYHCALYYRHAKGSGPLLPQGITIPDLPPVTETPTAPRVRARPSVDAARLPPGQAAITSETRRVDGGIVTKMTLHVPRMRVRPKAG